MSHARAWLLAFTVCQLCWLTEPSVVAPRAHHHSIPADYPQSLEQDLRTVLDATRVDAPTFDDLLTLAQLYLDIGDDLYTDKEPRRSAYQSGARAATHALALQGRHAEAHFLYAANLGNAARLDSMSSGVLTLQEVTHHVK